MAIITQESLQDLQARLGSAQILPQERLLAVAYLEQEFKLSLDLALSQTASGPNDIGLNAFWIDPQLKNLTIFQFQCSEARTCFQTAFQCLTELGMDRVFGQDPPGLQPDQFLMQLKSQMLTYQNAIDRVFVHLVFMGDPVKAEKSVVYEKLREDLETKKYLVDRFFGRAVTLVFQFKSVSKNLIGALAHQRLTHSYPLGLEKSIEMDGPAGERMLVGFARLVELHSIFKEMKQRFFESNIRSILSDQTPTNRSLNHAFESIVLQRDTDPLAYAFDHNGVTLYVEKVEQRDGCLLLTEPRLLNGAQTISSLDHFLQSHADDPRLGEGQQALGEISVLCKIITDARSDFVLRVTLNNNRQNPIKPWNLHANDMIQLELQDKFGEELGIYYERQERAFANLSDEAEERQMLEGKAIELLRLARTFLLADGDLDRNFHFQQVFEDETDYVHCFHLGRLGADSRDILLCYKIQFRLGRLIREIIEKGEKKYAYLKSARNLIWSLLCQAVLNDAELSRHRDAFGRKLGIEIGYVKWLEQLASSKVRLVISKAAEDPAYAAKIESEKLSFLNTPAFYRICMQQSKLKWGWEQKGLGKAMASEIS